MTQSIAFHSYKGGTGKIIIACNLAAMLTTKGYNVSLLDLNVYAPSLHAYFERTPGKWINDLLSQDAKIDDVMVDMTSVVEGYTAGSGKRLASYRSDFLILKRKKYTSWKEAAASRPVPRYSFSASSYSCAKT
jgi:Mrp family chromosome partitioning ATPase